MRSESRRPHTYDHPLAFLDNLSASNQSNNNEASACRIGQGNFAADFAVVEDSGLTAFNRRVVMEVVKSSGNGLYVADANSVSAQQVARAAHEELLQLMAQRAEVMKRIGTLKQTIAGLANLFGDQVLNDDLLELIDRKPTGRQPGFTKACRRVLMEVRRPLGAREVCVELERSAPTVLARHKDPLASVTTVLNRLVDYGEARSLNNDRGRRVWEWISEGDNAAQDSLAARNSA